MNSASLTGNATYAMTSAIKKASHSHLWAGGCSEGVFMLLAKVADPPQRTISTRLSGGGFRPVPRDRVRSARSATRGYATVHEQEALALVTEIELSTLETSHPRQV